MHCFRLQFAPCCVSCGHSKAALQVRPPALLHRNSDNVLLMPSYDAEGCSHLLLIVVGVLDRLPLLHLLP
jgi:hypothetical protein